MQLRSPRFDNKTSDATSDAAKTGPGATIHGQITGAIDFEPSEGSTSLTVSDKSQNLDPPQNSQTPRNNKISYKHLT